MKRKVYFNTILKDLIKKEIINALGSDYSVLFLDVPKNNDNIYQTISIIHVEKKDKNHGMLIPLNELDTSKPIKDIANQIITKYFEENNLNKNISDIAKYYIEKGENFVIKLINREKNKKLLRNVPYRNFLDLAMIITCDFKQGEGIYSVKMTKELMDFYSLNENILFDIAIKNTIKMYPILGTSTTSQLDVLQKGLFPVNNNNPIYLLTNTDNYYGSVALLYSDILNDIAKMYNDDYYIIPTSIHEVVLIPRYTDVSLDDLLDNIMETNRNNENEEILSNSLYLYKKEEGKIEIIC